MFDTVGKAVAFSALTVLASLAAILLVPGPAFRSMALGIVLSVIAVLAATLTLLPAVLGRLGTRANAGVIRLPRHRGQRAPLGPVPVAALRRGRVGGAGVLLLAAAPIIGIANQTAVDHDRSGS